MHNPFIAKQGCKMPEHLGDDIWKIFVPSFADQKSFKITIAAIFRLGLELEKGYKIEKVNAVYFYGKRETYSFYLEHCNLNENTLCIELIKPYDMPKLILQSGAPLLEIKLKFEL